MEDVGLLGRLLTEAAARPRRAVAYGICNLSGTIPAGKTVTLDATKVPNNGVLNRGPTIVTGTLAVDVGPGVWATVRGGGFFMKEVRSQR